MKLVAGGGGYPTWKQLRDHCRMCGNDTAWWPARAQNGQTTKAGVAWMLGAMMARVRAAAADKPLPGDIPPIGGTP